MRAVAACPGRSGTLELLDLPEPTRATANCWWTVSHVDALEDIKVVLKLTS